MPTRLPREASATDSGRPTCPQPPTTTTSRAGSPPGSGAGCASVIEAVLLRVGARYPAALALAEPAAPVVGLPHPLRRSLAHCLRSLPASRTEWTPSSLLTPAPSTGRA